MTSFTYHHERTGDIYVIQIDGDSFSAFCHIDRCGSDPIVYSDLDDIPDGPRHDIEQMIEELK